MGELIMKRLFNLIFKRSTTTLILFLTEIIISALIVLMIGKAFLIFGIFVYFFDIFIIFLIANGKSNPAYKISWIFSVILLPLVGGLLYITFGKRRTVKKFKTKFINSQYTNYNFIKTNKKVIEKLDIDSKCLQMINWIYNVSQHTVYKLTQTEFLSSGSLYFKSLINDLKDANKSIFLELFIISPGKMWGDILNILIEYTVLS
jgi:cardiolipin synthase